MRKHIETLEREQEKLRQQLLEGEHRLERVRAQEKVEEERRAKLAYVGKGWADGFEGEHDFVEVELQTRPQDKGYQMPRVILIVSDGDYSPAMVYFTPQEFDRFALEAPPQAHDRAQASSDLVRRRPEARHGGVGVVKLLQTSRGDCGTLQ